MAQTGPRDIVRHIKLCASIKPGRVIPKGASPQRLGLPLGSDKWLSLHPFLSPFMFSFSSYTAFILSSFITWVLLICPSPIVISMLHRVRSNQDSGGFFTLVVSLVVFCVPGTLHWLIGPFRSSPRRCSLPLLLVTQCWDRQNIKSSMKSKVKNSLWRAPDIFMQP